MQTSNNGAVQFSQSRFLAAISSPVKFRLYLLRNLPAAFFSGIKLRSLTEYSSVVSVPYKWFTRNPFRCTYFACLSMAAEMSTGILAMANVYNRLPKVSMLVTSIEGRFYKKATGIILFKCNEGGIIQEAVETCILEAAAQSIRISSSGFNNQNEQVAEFWITWSFKVKE